MNTKQETIQALQCLAGEGLLDIQTVRAALPDTDPALYRCAEAWEMIRHNAGPAARQCHFAFGPCGTGKTHWARCLLTRCKHRGWEVAEIRAREFLRISAAYGRQDSRVRFIERTADLVLIDDVDKADYRSRDYVEALLELVDVRTGRGLIFTSNLNARELLEMLIRAREGNTTHTNAFQDRLATWNVWKFAGASLR